MSPLANASIISGLVFVAALFAGCGQSTGQVTELDENSLDIGVEDDNALGLAAPNRGEAPDYRNRNRLPDRIYSSEQNESLINHYFFAPGLRDHYTAQGLAVDGDRILVSSYHATTESSAAADHCKVFIVDKNSGSVIGSRVIGACRHAGGLAINGDTVYVSDTRKLFRLTLSSDRRGFTGSVDETPLEGRVRGSFVASWHNETLYLGQWNPNGQSYLRRLRASALTARSIGNNHIDVEIRLPRKAQGASFDSEGRLWVTASGSRFGCLFKMNRNLDGYERVHFIPRASEDLKFESGSARFLWSVSESGAWNYRHWTSKTFFPFVFKLDTQNLPTIANNRCPDRNPPVAASSNAAAAQSPARARCRVIGGAGRELYNQQKTRAECTEVCNTRFTDRTNRSCEWNNSIFRPQPSSR